MPSLGRRVLVAACAAAAVAVVQRRRHWGVPPAVAGPLAAAAPVAFAAAAPAGRPRAVVAWAAHMWAYAALFEMPYDRPERLRARLHVTEALAVDTRLGLGAPPSQRLQRRLRTPPVLTATDWVATGVYAVWEAEPHAVMAWMLWRHPERFAAAAVRLGLTFDATLLGYWLWPAAPPWWASEQAGLMAGEVHRIVPEVVRVLGGKSRPADDHSQGANPWAAMPSDHFGSALATARIAWACDRRVGRAAAVYAVALGAALVYLGEHYATDLAAGAGVAAAVDAVVSRCPATRLPG